MSNVFVERAHPSRETRLSRTLTLNPGELMVASLARLILVFLLTKFTLVGRLDVLVLFFLGIFWVMRFFLVF